MIRTSFWSWLWIFSAPGRSHNFDNAPECGVNLKMKAQITEQELSGLCQARCVTHPFLGCYGHMEIVGTMVTEFFTAALQPFYMLGRIALHSIHCNCMYKVQMLLFCVPCTWISDFRPEQSSGCCKTFQQNCMLLEKNVIFDVLHGKTHIIWGA